MKSTKGILFSDLLLNAIFVGFLALSVFLAVIVSKGFVEERYDQIEQQKSGYATMQLLRTYAQTPITIDGETQSIAYFANEYFALLQANSDYPKQTLIRNELRALATQAIKPHLKDEKDSQARLSLYRYGREVYYIILTSMSKGKASDVQESNTFYIGTFQENTQIQLPAYIPSSNAQPGDEYLILSITEN